MPCRRCDYLYEKGHAYNHWHSVKHTELLTGSLQLVYLMVFLPIPIVGNIVAMTFPNLWFSFARIIICIWIKPVLSILKVSAKIWAKNTKNPTKLYKLCLFAYRISLFTCVAFLLWTCWRVTEAIFAESQDCNPAAPSVLSQLTWQQTLPCLCIRVIRCKKI